MATIFVDRERVWGRIRTIRNLQKRIETMCYCIFPEGTTTDRLIPSHEDWKAGHLLAVRDPGVRVIAAGIRYKDHKELAWIDE